MCFLLLFFKPHLLHIDFFFSFTCYYFLAFQHVTSKKFLLHLTDNKNLWIICCGYVKNDSYPDTTTLEEEPQIYKDELRSKFKDGAHLYQ